jgi:hypothetical protein
MATEKLETMTIVIGCDDLKLDGKCFLVCKQTRNS